MLAIIIETLGSLLQPAKKKKKNPAETFGHPTTSNKYKYDRVPIKTEVMPFESFLFPFLLLLKSTLRNTRKLAAKYKEVRDDSRGLYKLLRCSLLKLCYFAVSSKDIWHSLKNI